MSGRNLQPWCPFSESSSQFQRADEMRRRYRLGKCHLVLKHLHSKGRSDWSLTFKAASPGPGRKASHGQALSQLLPHPSRHTGNTFLAPVAHWTWGNMSHCHLCRNPTQPSIPLLMSHIRLRSAPRLTTCPGLQTPHVHPGPLSSSPCPAGWPKEEGAELFLQESLTPNSLTLSLTLPTPLRWKTCSWRIAYSSISLLPSV